MTQFSKWIDHAGTGCPVDPTRIVEIETPSGIADVEPRRAMHFNWNEPCVIVRYRVELTADEVAEEEEWARLEKASKNG